MREHNIGSKTQSLPTKKQTIICAVKMYKGEVIHLMGRDNKASVAGIIFHVKSSQTRGSASLDFS